MKIVYLCWNDVTTFTRTQNSAMLQSISHRGKPPYNFITFVNIQKSPWHTCKSLSAQFENHWRKLLILSRLFIIVVNHSVFLQVQFYKQIMCFWNNCKVIVVFNTGWVVNTYYCKAFTFSVACNFFSRWRFVGQSLLAATKNFICYLQHQQYVAKVFKIWYIAFKNWLVLSYFLTVLFYLRLVDVAKYILRRCAIYYSVDVWRRVLQLYGF